MVATSKVVPAASACAGRYEAESPASEVTATRSGWPGLLELSGRAGSVSTGWTEPRKALETVECYHELFKRYGDLYANMAPRVYRTKQLRYALYLALARRPGAWSAWRGAAHLSCFKESAATLGLLLMGPNASATVVEMAKRVGLSRRYG